MSEKGFVIWFTGLSGSGKSALGDALHKEISNSGKKCERLDGDVVRNIFPETGFAKDDRNTHIKKMGFIASLLEKNGIIVVASFISPYKESRGFVRELCSRFIEVYLSTPLETCEKRDVKGLYRRAREGEIESFTGISAPFETPMFPEIVIDTTDETVDQSLERIMQYLKERGFLIDESS